VNRDNLRFGMGIVVGLLMAWIAALTWPPDEEPDLARYREVRDFVRQSYVREVDPDELLDRALQGLVEGLDPYSRYYDENQVAALERDTTGRYRGIGVVFKRPLKEGRVLFALPGSPAEHAGMQIGDEVLSVNGRSIKEAAELDLQETIARADGPVLDFEVRRLDGSRQELRVQREELVDPTVRHGRMLDAEQGIGYLAITSFSQETPEEFDRELSVLKQEGLRALVIDVRGNLGGVLRSAVAIANRFVGEGLLVSTEGRGDPVRYEADPERALDRGLPLVVLVDDESASASEVFAAALQDHRAAVIVGSPTYGKGMVQKVRAFGGAQAEVKLTTAYYYTPAHRNLERTVLKAWEVGLQPDVRVELDSNEARRIRVHLASYSPPRSALPALRAWEEAEKITLVAAHPSDAQLHAAILLLRGKRPGPYPLAGRG
jgi:carboxyl-terminal processing protease